MKKLLVAAAVVTCVGAANAQSAFEGFYGQVGVGYESTKHNQTNGVAQGDSYTITNLNNSTGFSGTLTLGNYFAVTNSFLLGIGAEYSPLATSNANYTININGSPSTSQFKKNNSYNVFLSPALAIEKTGLAYAKVGFSGANVQTSDSSGTDKYNLTGYSLGLGYKQIIENNLYGFIESNYSSYGNKQVAGASGNISANSMNFLIGIGYRF